MQRFPARPAKYASFETLARPAQLSFTLAVQVNASGQPLLSQEARRALASMDISQLFEHQHRALLAAAQPHGRATFHALSAHLKRVEEADGCSNRSEQAESWGILWYPTQEASTCKHMPA